MNRLIAILQWGLWVNKVEYYNKTVYIGTLFKLPFCAFGRGRDIRKCCPQCEHIDSPYEPFCSYLPAKEDGFGTTEVSMTFHCKYWEKRTTPIDPMERAYYLEDHYEER